MSMTPEAKSLLSKTIRALRADLLEDLRLSNERTYQFATPIAKAHLTAAERARRRWVDAWIDEQVRSQPKRKEFRSEADFLRELELQAAYTLLNRMIILRVMEANKLRRLKVATGGWDCTDYKNFRSLAPSLVRDDESEGLAFLLQLVFEELAADLPGLFGPAGAAELVPVPPATLRAVIESLNDPRLESCWTDDMTLGWVYQYWNDPAREALDAKINDGGKIEPHEIASKTQMFTERYMVDWLLQNSLGPMWLAMCKRHGWTPLAESAGTLDALEQRRIEWRAKRDAGEVALTDLMPLHTELERRWAYYVPQPIPEDAVEKAPATIRDIKILDPAVGSGHFLVVAFELLFALYREEAKHRSGTDRTFDPDQWTDKAIVERILEHNLHGIDLDPRAVQIAAAALWLKAKQVCPEATPGRLNLVSSDLRLASLPSDDPALIELRRAVEQESGIPAELTNTLIQSLAGADHLGSLLKVDAAVTAAISAHEQSVRAQRDVYQQTLFGEPKQRQKRIDFDAMAARRTLVDALEAFLTRHTSGDDLGLRLRGEQLAAGVRFVRMLKEGTYDLVVANPPYQGTSKMASSSYITQHYPLGKADLYAAFLLRGLQLVREYGVSAMLTMRNWMFIKQYADMREHLLGTYDLRAIGDFDRGAFEGVPDEVVSVAVSIFASSFHRGASASLCPTPREDRSRDNLRTPRKRAATLCHVGRHDFDPASLKVVPEWPLVYWWDEAMLTRVRSAPSVGGSCRIRQGLATGNDSRYLRRPWEVEANSLFLERVTVDQTFKISTGTRWVPYIKGAAGKSWYEPVDFLLHWKWHGMDKRVNHEFFGAKGGNGTPSIKDYFLGGVVFASIGSRFSARLHRYRSVFGSKGCTAFNSEPENLCCALNSSLSKTFVQDVNPSIDYTISDIARVPLFEIADSSQIFRRLENAFSEAESKREPSVEFLVPGGHQWDCVEEWAQLAVDRTERDPMPNFTDRHDPEPPTDHLSFALGVALGRFGASGEGILDPTTTDLSDALPARLLFLDGTLSEHDTSDGLGHPAAAPLHTAWATYGPEIARGKKDLRSWLASDFFKDVHKGMYENRPIHWPLSSKSRTFVAWVNIHRMNGQTLPVLLADHLHPTLTRIEGELNDVRAARETTNKSAARDADKRYGQLIKWRDELAEMIERVRQCADRGAPPVDAKCPPREVDARYEPNLDDGVMINSAALWPLLEPQWKDPKKWWKELAIASPKGNKDYDWSHLAMRYWPTRVDAKCQQDPSLGVAHGCFWKYHPQRAWAWELRLQDEIGADFRIEECPYRGDGGDKEHRDAFLKDHPRVALAAILKEVTRRRRKSDNGIIEEFSILEPGIWSVIPEECWEMEMEVINKQQHQFRLIAPDEPQAREAWIRKNPSRLAARKGTLTLFGDDDRSGYLAGMEDTEPQPDSEAVEPS